jgi:hypothetical protein
MRNSIRQIHLFAAFVLTAFVLMYFITGIVMIFEETFKRKDDAVIGKVEVIPGVRQLSGDTLLSVLRKNFDLSGQYQVRRNAQGIVLDFRHPGTEINVLISNDSDSVKFTGRDKNIVSVMHQFHRLHGYHGGWNYQLWAFVYDLSALSMIVFAVTGFYLWYKTERERWMGWIIFIGFTIFTAFTLIYFTYLE